MQTVELDDEVYGFLLRNTNRFGESPSDVIRRLFKLTNAKDVPQATSKTEPLKPTSTQTVANTTNPVTAFLNSPSFLVHGNVVERFLSVLSWLYKQNPEKFEKVLLLNGRKRRYFAKSARELEDSGNSVMPKPIPNSPTELKKQVIEDVMRVLGYEPPVIRSAMDALSGRLAA